LKNIETLLANYQLIMPTLSPLSLKNNLNYKIIYVILKNLSFGTQYADVKY